MVVVVGSVVVTGTVVVLISAASTSRRSITSTLDDTNCVSTSYPGLPTVRFDVGGRTSLTVTFSSAGGTLTWVVFKLKPSVDERTDVLPDAKVSVTCTSAFRFRVVTKIDAPALDCLICTAACGAAAEAVTDAVWPVSVVTIAVTSPPLRCTWASPPDAATTTSAAATVTVGSPPEVSIDCSATVTVTNSSMEFVI